MKKGIVIAALVWTIISTLFVLSAPDEFIVWSLFYGAIVMASCIFYLQDSSNFLGLKRGIVIGTLAYSIISLLFCIAEPDEFIVWTVSYAAIIIASLIIYLVDKK